MCSLWKWIKLPLREFKKKYKKYTGTVSDTLWSRGQCRKKSPAKPNPHPRVGQTDGQTSHRLQCPLDPMDQRVKSDNSIPVLGLPHISSGEFIIKMEEILLVNLYDIVGNRPKGRTTRSGAWWGPHSVFRDRFSAKPRQAQNIRGVRVEDHRAQIGEHVLLLWLALATITL